MNDAHIDLETRGAVDLTKRGAYCYFEDRHVDVLMACYSFDGKNIQAWLRGQPCPNDLRKHIESGGLLWAHNASGFEQLAWKTVMVPRYGFPPVAPTQWRCTMATAAALGLPRSLEKLADALGLAVRKDKEGRELIRFFCLPSGYGETGEPIFNEPADHPEKFERFILYCRMDVLVESAACARMIPLSDSEQEVWLLDQKINERGVLLDVASIDAAIPLVARAQELLDVDMRALTKEPDGRSAVGKCSEVARLVEWCGSRGVALDAMDKNAVLRALERKDLPDGVRSALLMRQEAAKSSTAKLLAFRRRVSRDGRLRGSYVYHGAAPGRATSTGVNIANLPRPRAIYDDAHLDLGVLFSVIRKSNGDPNILRFLYGSTLGRPLDLISDALRSFILAKPGCDLIAIDYASIQNRVIAWLADETWKLDAFRELDADPSLPDLYRRSASALTGVPLSVLTKKHSLRQIGKTAELALQFMGGVAAFSAMAANYGLRLEEFYEPVWTAMPDEIREASVKRYERCCKAKDKVMTDRLSREAWLVAECTKLAWRLANPATVKLGHDLERAARAAVSNPGETFTASNGRLAFLCRFGFLFYRMPSGRCIAYANPKLKDQVWAKIAGDDGVIPDSAEVVERDYAERLEARRLATIEGATSAKITALAVDSQSQQFRRHALYSGIFLENAAMGCERDLLVRAMSACERAGYQVVLHSYDEAVCEVPRGQGSVKEMAALMCDAPAWAEGLPIAGDGWAGKRYRKA